jgi:hypothetical protein
MTEIGSFVKATVVDVKSGRDSWRVMLIGCSFAFCVSVLHAFVS